MAPTHTPTTNENIARAVLVEAHDDHIVLTFTGLSSHFNGTTHRMHLSVLRRPATEPGKRIRGLIKAKARRIDQTDTGGAYVEPVYGRPKRIQGTITAIDPQNDTVTINAGMPIICQTDPLQHAEHFSIGDFVACDLEPGASFIQTA